MNGSPTDDQQPRGEKRAQRRVYVQGRARVLTAAAESFDAELVDVSEGGVCMTSPVELALGTWCHLHIEMPPASTAQLSVAGQVCFCIEQHGAYRVGVHCADSDSLVAAVRDRESDQKRPEN